MDIGQITVKDLLVKHLGEESAARVIKDINGAYQEGKRGESIREHVEYLFEREGLDPGDVKFVMSHVLPTC
jgi:IS4 transposase